MPINPLWRNGGPATAPMVKYSRPLPGPFVPVDVIALRHFKGDRRHYSIKVGDTCQIHTVPNGQVYLVLGMTLHMEDPVEGVDFKFI
jgi:hypothetical protein